MKYIVKLEQVKNSFYEVDADSAMEAMRNAELDYKLHPSRFGWDLGRTYAKDVDPLDW
jgi:hypothetical protein